MYVQEIFKETQIEFIHEIIENNPLGTLTIDGVNGLSADHLPFILNKEGFLETHISSMNPISREIHSGSEALVIFNGGDCYISPSWMSQRYLSKKVQPTWVYAVVHVYCTIEFFKDETQLREHLDRAINFFERDIDNPWSIEEAPSDFINYLCKHIIGVKLNIKSIIGKSQLLQQRSLLDKQEAIKGLKTIKYNYKSSFMANLIEKYNKV
jgi:transcriptional regulator